MAETDERIRNLEQRLAQAEARIVNLETRQPEPVFQHGRLTYWPNTAAVAPFDPRARVGNQVPGLPWATCHACGLGQRCSSHDCPIPGPALQEP